MLLYVRPANPIYFGILENGPHIPMKIIPESVENGVRIPQKYVLKERANSLKLIRNILLMTIICNSS